jgi:AcrR family transcriptional regulator
VQFLREREQTRLLRADPLAADVDDFAANAPGFGAPANAVVRFEHDNGVARGAEPACRGEARETSADNRDIDRVRTARLRLGAGRECCEPGDARCHAKGSTARRAGSASRIHCSSPSVCRPWLRALLGVIRVRTCTNVKAEMAKNVGKAAQRTGVRARRQEEVRTRVLAAAKALFADEGVAGLSIRAIAARAGIPAMTLYSYFPGKMGIVRALWSEAFAPLFVELDAAEASEVEPRARLHKVARTMVDYWKRFPERYRIVFFIEDRRDNEDESWFIEETNVVAGYLRFAPLIAAARGDPEGDYLREAEALVCALNGIVHTTMGVSEYAWAAGESYVDIIVRGILAP